MKTYEAKDIHGSLPGSGVSASGARADDNRPIEVPGPLGRQKLTSSGFRSVRNRNHSLFVTPTKSFMLAHKSHKIIGGENYW